MAFVKKTWKDRIVQFANRRLLTKSGGEVEQVTVTRDEGTISEAGDQFNASNMNDLEQRIEDGLTGLTASDIEYSSGVTVADRLDISASFYVATVSNLTVTANSALNLGTVSELTGGRIATRYQCKGISVISGAGSNYSFLGAIVIGATDNVAIYPFRSDTNLSIRIGFLY